MKSIIEHIRENVQSGAYRLTFHGFERCVERGISPEEIRSVIFIGEVIETIREISTDQVVSSVGARKQVESYMFNARLIQFGLLQLMIPH